jgi:xylulokinase
MDYLIGLDIGTTNCKALAMDANSTPIAIASEPTPAQPPSSDDPSASPEYDAEELWQVSARLIHRVLEQLPAGASIAGVCAASMSEVVVLIDHSGAPLAPILTWHDRRTTAYVPWWLERLSKRELYAVTGLPLDYIFSANKLMWYRDHTSEAFRKAATWLGAGDWITFRLSGRRATAYSHASRTLLFDVKRRTWSDDLLRLTDIPAHLMPEPVPSGVRVGEVTQKAAQATGLPAGTPVVSGGHDHACAAIAAGASTSGVVLDSAGTAEAFLVTLDQPLLDAFDSGLGCGCHTAKDRYYLMGGPLVGGVVNWLGKVFGQDGDADGNAITRLIGEARRAPSNAEPLFFLPYLAGSGPPERNPDAWGAWLGLRLSHTRADLVRAAMEGLSFAMRQALDGMLSLAGIPRTHDTAADAIRPVLRAVGGGTRNEWLQQMKADVIGLPIEVAATTDMTPLGAALLAGIGVGIFADEAEAARKAYKVATRYTPDWDRHRACDAAYRDVFLKLYPAMKQLSLRINT